jgi:MFS family permease
MYSIIWKTPLALVRTSEASVTNSILPDPQSTTEASPPAVVAADAMNIAPMSRWFWVVYPLGLLGVNAVWGGVVQVLLGTQVAGFVGPDNAPAALGIVSSVAAVSSVVSQPIMGIFMDRTRSRFGRRNVWILAASFVSVAALWATAVSPSLSLLAVFWALAMWPLNSLQGALGAVMPERVPIPLRGSMSGLVGAFSLLGAFFGVAVAGLGGSVLIGYMGIAVVVLVTALLFAFTTKDITPQEIPSENEAARKLAVRMPGFRTAPDYWWTFAGRFTMIFGYFMIAAFQLYILQNYIGVGDGSIDAASAALVGLAGVSTIATIAAALLGGWLSDRFKRLRLFVALSTLLFVPAGLIYLLVPTYTGALVANVVLGTAFGIYVAVDHALISRVLPNMRNTARDLGIMNIANSGPQIIAPVVGGSLVTATGGNYQVLFITMMISVTISAIFVRFIRNVR